ncbi:hypothetical protein FHS51_003424 [Sphingobium wenxiniae]|jgi:hypothetical protein|uniref:Uncharacterized protein n=1 Tax=Sphingobium wenxiniae (strain DSM 21828 / CGMCC 1.7748 / JZ-1) TaxID=595605 RepID=A0A562K8M9_SPHWJ|nr:hypothetical protein [Sphingobium wenxiniae]MBB6193168.1 hypothetical protein [Sphingobium wenxiniae]MBE5074940.1 hypothetical protein [Erythrobacteraceae bacterium E2-1 Yellow Sea]TWH91614.1 hypothetical protein IQ35_03127 [Sphingobium wenxiniae]
MKLPNPFQTFSHCWNFACRRGRQDGDTYHVVATGHVDAPRTVLSDRALFAREDLAPEDIEASFDPFALASHVTGTD